MAASIIHDFDPVYDAINAVEDSITTAEYDTLIDTLNTAIASVAARIEKNTDIPIADINNAFGSYSASLKYPPGPTLAFANGARWAASRMVASVLTLPLVPQPQPVQKPA
jgi:hypothetical protein